MTQPQKESMKMRQFLNKRHLITTIFIAVSLALAVNQAKAHAEEQWIHIFGYGAPGSTISPCPHAMGNYDHAGVYVTAWAWIWDDGLGWFGTKHSIYIERVEFSTNPNGQNIYFDVWGPQLYDHYLDPQLVSGAVQQGNKWIWTPSPNGFEYISGKQKDQTGLRWLAAYKWEPRVNDAGSQTVYTYSIVWQCVEPD